MELKSRCIAASVTIISVVVYSSSIVIDSWLSYLYLKDNQQTHFGITLAILILPTVLVNIISLYWHICDDNSSAMKIPAAILQLGILYRHWMVFLMCIRKQVATDPDALPKLKERQRDLRMLHLYEVFLKSAPQLAFQLYVRYDTDIWNRFTVVSASLSLLSLCWAVIVYDIASWREKYNGEKGCCCFFLCVTVHEFGRIVVVLTRIVATAMMTVADDGKAPLLFGSQIALTLVFAMLTKKARGTLDYKSWVMDFFHNVAAAAAFTFSFIDTGGWSMWILMILLYAHASHQNWKCLVEFYKERLKYGAELHAFAGLGLMPCFVVGLICMSLCNSFCAKSEDHGFLFPNKDIFAEDDRLLDRGNTPKRYQSTQSTETSPESPQESSVCPTQALPSTSSA